MSNSLIRSSWSLGQSNTMKKHKPNKWVSQATILVHLPTVLACGTDKGGNTAKAP